MTRHQAFSLAGELIRFGFVGALATATHFVTAALLFSTGATGLFAANTAGFAAAFFVSYFGHHRVTFRSGTADLHSLLRFGIVALAGFGVNMALLALVTRLTGHESLFGLAISIGFAAGLVYVLSKRWVFAGWRGSTDAGRPTD